MYTLIHVHTKIWNLHASIFEKKIRAYSLHPDPWEG
jgi:hypothetical protein